MTEIKTATERLRELLDARGVEWRKFTEMARGSMELFHSTYYDSADGYKVRVTSWRDSETVAVTMMVTPEQAIAATLGSGECECESSLLWDCYHGRDFYEHRLSCGHIITSGFEEPPNYCEECGAKVRKAVKR